MRLRLLSSLVLVIWIQNPVFSSNMDLLIEIEQEDETVLITFNPGSNLQAYELDIYRSTDSVEGFEKIGHIKLENDLTDTEAVWMYSFKDLKPIPNTINYYKLVQVNNEVINIESIYFASYNFEGYSVFNDEAQTFLFTHHNLPAEQLVFQMFDITGRHLPVNYELQTDKISIPNAGLQHGFYLFILQDRRGQKICGGQFYIP